MAILVSLIRPTWSVSRVVGEGGSKPFVVVEVFSGDADVSLFYQMEEVDKLRGLVEASSKALETLEGFASRVSASEGAGQ